jgi:hypothetical protein
MKLDQTLGALLPPPAGTLLVVGKKGTHQDQVTLNVTMNVWAKDKTKVVFCCHDEIDGLSFVDQAKNWAREQDLSNDAFDLLARDVTYIKECDNFKPEQLAEEIYKRVGLGNALVIRDTSRHFGQDGAFWHQYAAPIVEKTKALVILVAGTDTMGANGPYPANYTSVWNVSDYNPWEGQRERVNNAVLVRRTHNGETLPPIILRDTPGICSWLWHMTGEEPVAA